MEFWEKEALCAGEIPWGSSGEVPDQPPHEPGTGRDFSKLIHELVEGGRPGAAIGYSPVYGLDSSPKNMLAMLNAEDLKNHFFLDIYFKGKYPVGAFRYLEEHGHGSGDRRGRYGDSAQRECWTSWALTTTQASACASRMLIRMS